ncbi:MAG: hypothetical protein IKY94_06525 [Lachnospiraceae bacterium]|nr:hypothetical protein [Clostridia bacterium]MBR4982195.1 hypothetical protein [Lachnospiraceae bacterium]
MENQVVEKEVKAPRVKLTPEEAKANRAAAAKRTLEKRKANGVAAKQFFIHKSLFKEAEEIMAPILAKSKELVAQNA